MLVRKDDHMINYEQVLYNIIKHRLHVCLVRVVALLQLIIPCFSGLTNLYTSQVFWCSTRVDINGFHVRGPYNNMGVSRY